MRRIACCVAVAGLAVLTTGTPAGSQSRLGTPEVIAPVTGEANLIAASSVPGHPDAYAVFHRKIGANVYKVIHRDAAGHAHSFNIPVRSGTFPHAVRLVGLEHGGGMAVWDDARAARILARSWTRDGRLGATEVVMDQVQTTHSADFDTAQWRLRADGRGTVVVVTTALGEAEMAAVFATVRDPGGAFGPRQRITGVVEPPVPQRQIRISPIAPDGSVLVAWGPEYGSGPGGRAGRVARSPVFGPPEVYPFTAEVPLSAASRTAVTEGGSTVTISGRLARRCPCTRPQVFRWGDGTTVLALQRLNQPYLGDWYVARQDSAGVFDAAVLATRHASSYPMRRARPGEVGFARFDTETDYGLFRQRSRLVVVPFGDRVRRSRRAPRLGIGGYGRATRTRLLVPVWCDRVCTVSGRTSRGRRLAINDSLGRASSRRLEPFTVAYLRVPLRRGRTSERVRASAVDNAGHRSSARGRFLRSRRYQFWCRGGRTC